MATLKTMLSALSHRLCPPAPAAPVARAAYSEVVEKVGKGRTSIQIKLENKDGDK